MEAVCPHCSLTQEVPWPGSYVCTACGQRFDAPAPEVTPSTPSTAPTPSTPAFAIPEPEPIPEPAPVPPVVPALAAVHSGALCSFHPANAATGVCERCGDFICRLCTTAVDGRVYCPRCFDLLFRRGALSFAQSQFTLPGITLGVGILAFLASLVCVCVINVLVSVPAGIGGVIVGLRALKEHNARPDLPGRTLTLWGVGLSGVALLVSLLEIGFWLLAFFGKR